MSSYQNKYLIRSNGVLYTVEDGNLVEAGLLLNAELFRSRGMDAAPSQEVLFPLQTFDILKWAEEGEPAPNFEVLANALPFQQQMIAESFTLTDFAILGIDNVECVYTGTPLISLSFDNGGYEFWNGVSWESGDGMTPEVLLNIPSSVWTLRIKNVTNIRVRVIINDRASSFSLIKFNFLTNE